MGAGVAGVCVLAWLLTLSVYDIRKRRLPNWLTMPGAAVILATAGMFGRGAPAVLGAVALSPSMPSCTWCHRRRWAPVTSNSRSASVR